MASTVEKSRATQKMPGAACWSDAWSGPMAKASSTSTSNAKGTICHTPTRERASMRRSLPATRTASCNMRGLRRTRDRLAGGDGGQVGAPPTLLLAGHPAPAHGDDAVGQRNGELRLVRGQEHRGAVGHRLADELAEELARRRIEPGVWLGEQPERGAAGQGRGERDPAARAGRERAGGRGAQAAGEADTGQGRLGPFARQTEGAHGEANVL